MVQLKPDGTAVVKWMRGGGTAARRRQSAAWAPVVSRQFYCSADTSEQAFEAFQPTLQKARVELL